MVWYKKVLTALLAISALSVSSCSESINVDEERRSENEKAFLSYSTDARGFERVSLPGDYGDRYIYMKKTVKGTGTVSPRATDRVKMRYQVSHLTSYQSGNPLYFEGNMNALVNTISPMSLTSTIAGVSIALQNMVVGDRAEVLIPWYLAYGAGQVAGLSYSALYFDIELLSIESTEAE